MLAQVKIALSYDEVRDRVEGLVKTTPSSPAEIADCILASDDLTPNACKVLIREGLIALARQYVGTSRRTTTTEYEPDPMPLLETLLETGGDGVTNEIQKKRTVPNISKNHRKMIFRGLSKKYTNASGDRVAILEFGPQDTAFKLSVLLPQRDGLNLTIEAFQKTDAVLRKYSAKAVKELSNNVQGKLDVMWLEAASEPE